MISYFPGTSYVLTLESQYSGRGQYEIPVLSAAGLCLLCAWCSADAVDPGIIHSVINPSIGYRVQCVPISTTSLVVFTLPSPLSLSSTCLL